MPQEHLCVCSRQQQPTRAGDAGKVVNNGMSGQLGERAPAAGTVFACLLAAAACMHQANKHSACCTLLDRWVAGLASKLTAARAGQASSSLHCNSPELVACFRNWALPRPLPGPLPTPQAPLHIDTACWAITKTMIASEMLSNVFSKCNPPLPARAASPTPHPPTHNRHNSSPTRCRHEAIGQAGELCR